MEFDELNFVLQGKFDVESVSMLWHYGVLTHCGLLTPYGDIELSQQWFR